MAEMTKHPHGTFCWVDLSTTDMDAAAAWYGALLGWDAAPQDTQGGPPYTNYRLRGLDVAGMGRLSDELRAAGVPAMWNAYICVDDVEAITTAVTEHGGKVVMPAMQILEAGTMAIFADPQGAAFCVWKPQQHIGVQLHDEAGALSWCEVVTRDVEGAKAFYEKVFGWTFETSDVGGTPYTLIHADGEEVGGITPMDDAFGGVPPHLMVYFNVDDLGATIATVEETGGSVHVPPTTIPVGTFAVVADPQGATFTLFEPPAQG